MRHNYTTAATVERALLASIIIDPLQAPLLGDLPSSAFADPQAAAVADAMRSLTASGRVIDECLLVAELAGAAEFDCRGPAPFLASILDDNATAANAAYYRDEVAREWRQRRAIESLEAAFEGAFAGNVDDAFRRLLVDVNAIGLETRRGFALDAISTVDLLDNSPCPTYLIEGVLVAGQPAVIGGSFKTLKTTVAIDLAVSLATGRPFLGYFKTPIAQRVGLVSGESGRHTLAETCSRVCSAAGVDPRKDLRDLIWSTTVPSLTDVEQLDAVRRFVVDHELTVLLLDPLYLMLGSAADSAGNLYGMGRVFANLCRIGQETNCTLVLIHHSSRGASRAREFRPVELGDLAFAGAAEFTRQWLLLGRRSEYDPNSGKHELWLTVGGSAGHGGVWALDVDQGVQGQSLGGRRWEVDVLRPDDVREARASAAASYADAKRQEAVDELRQRVVSALWSCDDRRATRTELQNRLGNCNWGRLKDALASLLADGTIIESSIVRQNRKTPYEGFRLVADDGAGASPSFLQEHPGAPSEG